MSSPRRQQVGRNVQMRDTGATFLPTTPRQDRRRANRIAAKASRRATITDAHCVNKVTGFCLACQRVCGNGGPA